MSVVGYGPPFLIVFRVQKWRSREPWSLRYYSSRIPNKNVPFGTKAMEPWNSNWSVLEPWSPEDLNYFRALYIGQ